MLRTIALKRTAIVRKTPMHHTAASLARSVLPRPKNPPRPPTEQRKRTESEYARQRREAIARDGAICRFLRRVGGVTRECGAEAHQVAHIERRHVCGKARAHVDVVLRACVDCHQRFDLRLDPDVTVPLERAQRCYDTIVAMNPRTSPPPGGRPTW